MGSNAAGKRLLVAVLLNPPTGDGKRTYKHLQLAGDIFQCDSTEIVNLYPGATRNLAELGWVGSCAHVWIDHRPEIATALLIGNEVLLGWGLSLPSGHARKYMKEQTRWVVEELHSTGLAP